MCAERRSQRAVFFAQIVLRLRCRRAALAPFGTEGRHPRSEYWRSRRLRSSPFRARFWCSSRCLSAFNEHRHGKRAVPEVTRVTAVRQAGRELSQIAFTDWLAAQCAGTLRTWPPAVDQDELHVSLPRSRVVDPLQHTRSKTPAATRLPPLAANGRFLPRPWIKEQTPGTAPARFANASRKVDRRWRALVLEIGIQECGAFTRAVNGALTRETSP